MAGLFPKRYTRRVTQDRRRQRPGRRLTQSRAPGVESLETRAMLALSVIETDASWVASAADPGSDKPCGTIWRVAHRQPRWLRQVSLRNSSITTPR
jgi:hypothetical protein